MSKRKVAQVATDASEPLRRSTRRKIADAPADAAKKTAPKPSQPFVGDHSPEVDAETADDEPALKPKPKPKAGGRKKAAAPSKPADKAEADEAAGDDGERSYWLLKAEPESRFENGVDVKFSIDDLAARTEPEPWDGIRNYVARNNLRAMKKGDLAFFYHSNCKEPGLVGTMEIVREHSPDLSAHDPKAPYHDASSKPADPKWSVVHVEFRSKFARQIGLRELREMGAPGKPLAGMQMLKQTRLSVSRVAAGEWAYLMGVVEERGGTL